MSGSDRLLIVDGNNLVHRSYHATLAANLRDGKGNPTGAIYGTVKAFLGLLRELEPTHCVWFFDEGESQLRTRLLPTYKGHRKFAATGTEARPDRDDLNRQFGEIRRFFDAVGVANHSQDGVEADDLIARAVLTERWPDDVGTTVIASSDHDLFQLVTGEPSVSVFRPGEREKTSVVGLGARSGGSGRLYGVPDVITKYGLPPYRLPEAWALMGDRGDNIEGIPGVGIKTAVKWIDKHGSLSRALAFEPKCEGYERLCGTNLKMIELDGTVGKIPFGLESTRLKHPLVNGDLPSEGDRFCREFDISTGGLR